MKARLALWIACLLPAAALAQIAASANYSISAATFDSGGKTISSSNYTVNASASSLAANSQSSSSYAVLGGYPGELYNVVGLLVTAPALSVDGGLDFQVGAAQTLDDNSCVAVNPGSVTWNVLTGPISGVNSDGVATAETVSRDTSATIQGSYGGFTGSLNLTVIPLAISTQNSRQTAAPGQPFTFTISPLSGEGPFTCQWLFNGSAIPGASGTSYTIGSAAPSSAGNYTVQVSNSLGSFITGAFNLIVNPGVPAMTAWAFIALPLLLFAMAARYLPKARPRP